MPATLRDSSARFYRTVTNFPLLSSSLVIGFIIRIFIITHDRGMYVADEFAKSIEQGHRYAFGYGIIPWEFVRGAVTWLFPGAIGIVMKLSSVLGFDRPEQMIWIVQFLLCVASLLTAYGTFRLARNLGASSYSAQFAGAFMALAGPILYFSHRALTEVASAPFVVFGFVYMTRKDESRRDIAMGASLFGIATMLRLQNIAFPACVALMLIVTLKARPSRTFVLVTGIWIAILGVFDKITWGHFFNSTKEYIAFNVFENNGTAFGKSPATYYFSFMWHTLGVLAIILILASVLSIKKSTLVTASWIVFFAIHIGIGHKEARFIFVIFPLIAATAALGFDLVIKKVDSPKFILYPILTSLLIYTAVRLPNYTWGTVNYPGRDQHQTAWDLGGDANRLLDAAYRQKDMCGIKDGILPWYFSGNYAQLHRRVPLYGSDETPSPSFYNYLITNDSSLGTVVATDRNAKLVRVSDHCERDPNYTLLRH